MNKIELQEIFKIFGNRELFNGLNAHFEKGSVTNIKGRSGAGKSTLINIIYGFEFPDKGIVLFDSKQATPNDYKLLRKNTGFVPQNVSILGNGNVIDVVIKKFQFKANKSQIPNENDILEIFGKLHLAQEIIHSDFAGISGGEKQRVAIAIALLSEKSVLIFDEPTSGLDDISKKSVAEIIANLKDKIVIISSHDSIFTSISNSTIILPEPQ